MVASSLFIFSVGFFIYAVSPAYANTEKTSVKTKTDNVGDEYIIEANGYLYYWYDTQSFYKYCNRMINGEPLSIFTPKKIKLP
jgi:hypothetical protein